MITTSNHLLTRFFPTSNTNSLPRMDIETYYDEFGICNTQWQTDGGTQTYAHVQLSPGSACTVPRTIIHEVRQSDTETDVCIWELVKLVINSQLPCDSIWQFIRQIMHGFSMYHTHKRPDRDQHIRVLWNNISPGKEPQFEYCSGCCCDTWDEPYDCSSVMHYASNQMSSNGRDTLGKSDLGRKQAWLLSCFLLQSPSTGTVNYCLSMSGTFISLTWRPPM